MPVNAFVPASATVDANGIESGGVECVDPVLQPCHRRFGFLPQPDDPSHGTKLQRGFGDVERPQDLGEHIERC